MKSEIQALPAVAGPPTRYCGETDLTAAAEAA
jgi:hypothetical protein